MLKSGLIDEVENLKQKYNLTLENQSMKAIGYKQVYCLTLIIILNLIILLIQFQLLLNNLLNDNLHGETNLMLTIIINILN